MQFLRSVLGTSSATKDIPYNIGEAYSSAWGSWTHFQGTAKDTGDPVSIFTLTGSNAQDARLAAARNGAKRLRTLRHPNVLNFLYTSETEKEEGGVVKPTIYLVTEPVMPLADKIRELKLEGSQRDEYFAWGLHQVSKAVSFLNNDCKLVHGNICVAAVVVTPTLDWKLHAFDVLSEFDGANADAEGPMLPYDWLVGQQYKPLELTKGDWSVVRKGPPYAIDSWGLGCLIQELFSASKLQRTEELRNTSSLPKLLLPAYQRLLGSQPPRRLNSSKLTENNEFFQNRLVDTIHFMDVLNLKDSVEKDAFFRKLPTVAEQLPREIVLKKLLPQLASALEFGAASAAGLNPLLKLGAWLPTDEFNTKILPTVIKLFASADRGIRVGLLQNMEMFGSGLSAAVVDEQVFNHVATGFSDTSAFLRELTLKAMLVLAPNLSQRTLTGSLLKFLSKLQVDEEAAIRTNTTILLGNIARYLNDSTRKRVLVNAFTVRALRDTFPPARSAGIMALMATKEYYDVMEIGTRILPNLVVLTVDPDPDVRTKACQGTEVFLNSVKDFYAKADAHDVAGAGADAKSFSSAGSTAPSVTTTTGLLSWAVSSLTSTKGAGATSSASATAAASLQPTALATTVSAPADVLGEAAAAAVALSDGAAPTSSLISENGWGDDHHHAIPSPVAAARRSPAAASPTDDDDNDGWDDLEEEAVVQPAALARIHAAQRKPPSSAAPAATPSRPLVSKTTPSPLGTKSTAGTTAPTSTAVPATRSRSNTSSGGESTGWSGAEDKEDPWAAIAAPTPVSSARPLSSGSGTASRPSAGGRGASGGAARSSSSTGGHVQLGGALGSLSLDDMLGDSSSSGSKTGSGKGGRGASRGGPLKLGAQRVVR
eukprot:TRINITY_DN3474_c1_g1_i1.p1 TRINITY_DN3474_c1_g1~~TRINITY_DN3474_c1_g1_i1.p1  ORF type:complete len:880 (-),score=157.79 TRINITY_DN3474_c1_g1_i1:1199-3838(-)